VGVHHRDELRIGAQRRSDGRGRDAAVRRRLEPGDGPSRLLEMPRRVEHGFVLGARHDEVPPEGRAAARDAEQREVVRLGGTRGEHDVGGRGADQRRDLGTRALDARGGGTAVEVRRARGVAETLRSREACGHRRGRARVDGRRGGVVEEDRQRDAHGRSGGS